MTYVTTPRRVIAALAAAAVVGPVLLTLALTAPDYPTSSEGWLLGAISALAIGIPAFGLALLVWGGPFWLLFHYLNWRSLWMATVPGLAAGVMNFLLTWWSSLDPADTAPGVSGVIYTHGHMTSYGWWQTTQVSVVTGLVSAFVGVLIWRIAYRPVPAGSEAGLS